MNRGQPIFVVLFAVVITGCVGGLGGSSSSSTIIVTTTTSTTIASAQATAEFVACMGENGIDVGEIPFDANGRPRLEMIAERLDFADPATTEAMGVCAGVLAEGALDLAFDDSYREAVVGQLAAFSRCVRARGVDDFPDPIPGFLGVGPPYPVAEIPYNDPALPAAVEACERTVFGEPDSATG
jgi:hypothetical protein